MTRHGLDYYHIIKFQVENYMRGVFPLWDPFLFWGRPDNIDSRFVGEFNPFLWLYAIFSWLGVSPPSAYAFYSTIYYFVGLIGFYLLAKRFLKDELLAVLGFVALMFSSLAITVFNNYCITLLWVPIVWFFYFLLAFSQDPRRKFILGLTFSIMLLTTTYMPFYFLTIFACFLIGIVLFYFGETKAVLKKSVRFVRENKVFVLLCGLAIGASMIPGILWFLASEKGEYILSWRHAGSDSLNAASMNFDKIASGSIVGPMTFKGLFSDLSHSNQLLFFVSIFVYIVLCLSIINGINRKSLFLIVVGFPLFLLTLTDLTPVLKYLYDHFYIFRLFRNIFYLLYLAIVPLVILFVLEQLRLFLDFQLKNGRERGQVMAFVCVVHLLFALFLYQQGGIIFSSYATVALSCIFFLLYFSKKITLRQPIAWIFLLALIVTQPMEVFYHSRQGAVSVVDWFPKDRFYPRFSFMRPPRTSETDYYSYHKGRSPQGVQDSSGFETWKYTGLYRSYWLHENVNHNILENYTKHKFVVYDAAEMVDERVWDFKRFENSLQRNENLAFVFADEEIETAASRNRNPQLITAESDALKVEDFDLNHIRIQTNFDAPKWLVYNDSYDHNWRAWLNGKPALQRANYTFKAMYLPAGVNRVEFRYGSMGMYILNYSLLILYAGIFLYLLRMWWMERGEKI